MTEYCWVCAKDLKTLSWRMDYNNRKICYECSSGYNQITTEDKIISIDETNGV